MCQFMNEPDDRFEFLQTVIDQKDRRIEELEELVDELRSDIRGLECQIWGSQW